MSALGLGDNRELTVRFRRTIRDLRVLRGTTDFESSRSSSIFLVLKALQQHQLLLQLRRPRSLRIPAIQVRIRARTLKAAFNRVVTNRALSLSDCLHLVRVEHSITSNQHTRRQDK
jgi:hypothetical protein